eukprot:m.14308 g.14308  ORF g.14308 m.14308 type:complete len:986 (-) comp6192_c0_seq2:220-3177(-)
MEEETAAQTDPTQGDGVEVTSSTAPPGDAMEGGTEPGADVSVSVAGQAERSSVEEEELGEVVDLSDNAPPLSGRQRSGSTSSESFLVGHDTQEGATEQGAFEEDGTDQPVVDVEQGTEAAKGSESPIEKEPTDTNGEAEGQTDAPTSIKAAEQPLGASSSSVGDLVELDDGDDDNGSGHDDDGRAQPKKEDEEEEEEGDSISASTVVKSVVATEVDEVDLQQEVQLGTGTAQQDAQDESVQEKWEEEGEQLEEQALEEDGQQLQQQQEKAEEDVEDGNAFVSEDISLQSFDAGYIQVDGTDNGQSGSGVPQEQRAEGEDEKLQQEEQEQTSAALVESGAQEQEQQGHDRDVPNVDEEATAPEDGPESTSANQLPTKATTEVDARASVLCSDAVGGDASADLIKPASTEENEKVAQQQAAAPSKETPLPIDQSESDATFTLTTDAAPSSISHVMHSRSASMDLSGISLSDPTMDAVDEVAGVDGAQASQSDSAQSNPMDDLIPCTLESIPDDQQDTSISEHPSVFVPAAAAAEWPVPPPVQAALIQRMQARQSDSDQPAVLVMEYGSPGIQLESLDKDPVVQLAQQHGVESLRRRSGSITRSSHDEVKAVQLLIKDGGFRGVLQLTSSFLSRHGQGKGQAGQPTRVLHTPDTMQMWLARTVSLIKLGMFETAEVELKSFGSFDRPDLFFEYYAENRFDVAKGSMVPFSLRLLYAVLPSFQNRHQTAFDRTYELLQICNKMLLQYQPGSTSGSSTPTPSSPTATTVDERSSSLSELTSLTSQPSQACAVLWRARRKRVLQALAMLFMQLQDYAMAIDCYTQLLQAEPGNIHILSTLGRILLLLGDLKLAHRRFVRVKDCVKESGQLPDENPIVLMNTGLLEIAKGQYLEARACFQHLLELDAVNAAAVNNLAVASLYCGQLSEAIQTMETHLQQATTLEATTVFNLASLFELESAMDHIKKKSWIPAILERAHEGFDVSVLRLSAAS